MFFNQELLTNINFTRSGKLRKLRNFANLKLISYLCHSVYIIVCNCSRLVYIACFYRVTLKMCLLFYFIKFFFFL